MVRQGNSSGVLVIIAGGNVGLSAASDRRGEWTVRPATVPEIRRIVLGGTEDNFLVIREGGVEGVQVRVDFRKVRRRTQPEYLEAEDLDSAQVDPSLWEDLAAMVYNDYGKYEGYVILHGLDTMAYTASALSFMLGNLQVPIVLTGAQRPLNYGRTDAVQNIIASIALAASRSLGMSPVIPEVSVFSHDTLFRGNRVTMVSSSSYRSFDSPNYPPLAIVGEHVEVQTHVIRKPSQQQRINLRGKANARVVIVDVFPGMDAKIIQSLVDDKSLRGVLLRTYGMGTAPTSRDFLKALQDLVDSGIVVMNVTQARSGRISHGQDPVSLRLFEQGVISGVDMTSEAAYAKMVVEMSDTTEEPEILADALQITKCGEQTQSIFQIHYGANETTQAESIFRAYLSPKRLLVERRRLNLSDISYVQMRMLGVAPVQGAAEKISRAIDIDLALIDRNQEPDELVQELKQDTLRWSAAGRPTINVAYDITSAKGHILDPDIILRLDTYEAIRWKRLSIAIFADVEY